MTETGQPESSLPAHPSFAETARVFMRIGVLSFGGPAGQIALMQHEIVDRRRWVDQDAFLRALNLCHLLPGPEAQQLATWIGWRLHGSRGGLAAGLLFVVPGALVMLGLSLIYVQAARADWFQGLFMGIKAAVVAIVAQALVRIAGRALGTPAKRLLALAALMAIGLADAPFPVVVLGAGVLGAMLARMRPEWLGARHAAAPAVAFAPRRRLIGDTAITVALWLVVWFAPMGWALPKARPVR